MFFFDNKNGGDDDDDSEEKFKLKKNMKKFEINIDVNHDV